MVGSLSAGRLREFSEQVAAATLSLRLFGLSFSRSLFLIGPSRQLSCGKVASVDELRQRVFCEAAEKSASAFAALRRVELEPWQTGAFGITLPRGPGRFNTTKNNMRGFNIPHICFDFSKQIANILSSFRLDS